MHHLCSYVGILLNLDCIAHSNYLSGVVAYKSIGDYYILPSSVHEVIVLPASKKNNEAVNLVQMVKEINVTEVAPEEKLSDEVYFFDGRYLKAVNNMEM